METTQATERAIDIKKTKEHLKCILTEKEIREAGSDLAQKYSTITELEDAKKSLMSDFKAKIDAETAEAGILARKIQNGYEIRPVECEEIWEYDLHVVSTVRQDTGETIRERNMTADELQKGLFG